MFKTKALIFVLLSSSFALALPVADPGLADTIKSWYNSTKATLQDTYQFTRKTVDDFYKNAKASVAYMAGLSEDAILYLDKEAAKARDVTLDQIQAIKNGASVQIENARKATGKSLDWIEKEVALITKQSEEAIAEITELAQKKWEEQVKYAEEYANQEKAAGR